MKPIAYLKLLLTTAVILAATFTKAETTATEPEFMNGSYQISNLIIHGRKV